MSRKGILFIVLFMLCIAQANAQKIVTINFLPTLNNDILEQDKIYSSPTLQDEISISTLRFYISAVQFWQNEKMIFEEKESYHLVDVFENENKKIKITLPENAIYNQIKFQLGIDSATNASGALGGDLDPTKGMYWTWQNGYINFKLEGTSTKSTARNHTFEYHVGGYASPYATIQKINIFCEKNKDIYLEVNVNNFIDKMDFAKFDHLMLPGEEAVKLSEKAKTMYSLQR